MYFNIFLFILHNIQMKNTENTLKKLCSSAFSIRANWFLLIFLNMNHILNTCDAVAVPVWNKITSTSVVFPLIGYPANLAEMEKNHHMVKQLFRGFWSHLTVSISRWSSACCHGKCRCVNVYFSLIAIKSLPHIVEKCILWFWPLLVWCWDCNKLCGCSWCLNAYYKRH